MTNLGYKYDEVTCDEQAATTPLVPCRPHALTAERGRGRDVEGARPDLLLANQAPPPMAEDDRQRRMIYNTNEYSIGKQGHEFTKALDDHEVDAILEYLKTL